MNKVRIKLSIYVETEYNISQVRDIIGDLCIDPNLTDMIKEELDCQSIPTIYSSASYNNPYGRKN